MGRSLLVVAGLLQNEVGHFLLTQRLAEVHQPLTWEFPGGKCHPEETPEAALVRELHEELGIHVTSLEPWWFVSHAYDRFHLVLLLYRVLGWRGEPQPLQALQLGWFGVEAMAGLSMPEADRPIVERMRNKKFCRGPGDHHGPLVG